MAVRTCDTVDLSCTAADFRSITGWVPEILYVEEPRKIEDGCVVVCILNR